MKLNESKLYQSLSARDKFAVRHLTEAAKSMREAKRALREDDTDVAVNAIENAEAQVAQADVSGVSEEVKANITGVQSALDALKTAAGMTEVDPMEGNAEAGIPPVETASGTSMGAEDIQGLQEKFKRCRNAFREAESRKAKNYWARKCREVSEKLEEAKLNENKKPNRASVRESNRESAREAARKELRAKIKARIQEEANKMDLDFVDDKVASKIKFKNDKSNNPAALEKTMTVNTAKKGTYSKGRVNWPNKDYSEKDLKDRADKDMNHTITYKRSRKVAEAKEPIMDAAEKLTESEKRAIDRYLGKGRFDMSSLEKAGITL